jgi:hypothetical protein
VRNITEVIFSAAYGNDNEDNDNEEDKGTQQTRFNPAVLDS